MHKRRRVKRGGQAGHVGRSLLADAAEQYSIQIAFALKYEAGLPRSFLNKKTSLSVGSKPIFFSFPSKKDGPSTTFSSLLFFFFFKLRTLSCLLFSQLYESHAGASPKSRSSPSCLYMSALPNEEESQVTTQKDKFKVALLEPLGAYRCLTIALDCVIVSVTDEPSQITAFLMFLRWHDSHHRREEICF